MPQNPVKTTLFVSEIKAGTGVSVSPTSGTGIVTINAGGALVTFQVGLLTTTQLAVGPNAAAGASAVLSTTQVGALSATQISSLTVSGTVVANGVTPVVVANAAVTASSQILLTLKTAAGTVGVPHVVTITPGTGFNFGSSASDTSTYNYTIVG